jgi:type III secretory pathway component EscU
MILSILLMFAGLILICFNLTIGIVCLFLAAFFDGELSRYKIYYQLKLSKRL